MSLQEKIKNSSGVTLKIEKSTSDLFLFNLLISFDNGIKYKSVTCCMLRNTKVYLNYTKLMFIVFLLTRLRMIDNSSIQRTVDSIKNNITG